MKKSSWDYIFVGLQFCLFVLFAILILLPHPGVQDWPKWVLILGDILLISGGLSTLVAILQLGDSLTAYPTPKSNAALRTHGLYRWVRHPIYGGILLCTLGISLNEASLLLLGITLLLGILFYYKSKYEEKGLIQYYGASYLEYRKTRGRFFPKLTNIWISNTEQ